jgi:hypothetical protein
VAINAIDPAVTRSRPRSVRVLAKPRANVATCLVIAVGQNKILGGIADVGLSVVAPESCEKMNQRFHLVQTQRGIFAPIEPMSVVEGYRHRQSALRWWPCTASTWLYSITALLFVSLAVGVDTLHFSYFAQTDPLILSIQALSTSSLFCLLSTQLHTTNTHYVSQLRSAFCKLIETNHEYLKHPTYFTENFTENNAHLHLSRLYPRLRRNAYGRSRGIACTATVHAFEAFVAVACVGRAAYTTAVSTPTCTMPRATRLCTLFSLLGRF